MIIIRSGGLGRLSILASRSAVLTALIGPILLNPIRMVSSKMRLQIPLICRLNRTEGAIIILKHCNRLSVKNQLIRMIVLNVLV